MNTLLILVGSFARNEVDNVSDVDLVLVGEPSTAIDLREILSLNG